MYSTAIRTGGFPAAAPAPPPARASVANPRGASDSRNGNATAAPRPRSTVRREMAGRAFKSAPRFSGEESNTEARSHRGQLDSGRTPVQWKKFYSRFLFPNQENVFASRRGSQGAPPCLGVSVFLFSLLSAPPSVVASLPPASSAVAFRR